MAFWCLAGWDMGLARVLGDGLWGCENVGAVGNLRVFVVCCV